MYVTDEEKAKILKLFYRTILDIDEEIINNSDEHISMVTGISQNVVSRVIINDLKKKKEIMLKRINNE